MYRLVLYVSLFTAPLLAQTLKIGEWKNYTPMRNVRAVAGSADSVWAATSGGLFLFVPSAQRFEQFTTADGLASIDLTALTFDSATQSLWIGSAEGYVQRLDVGTKTFTTADAIYRSELIKKRILRLSPYNADTLYIATQFGIVVYLPRKGEFGDSYLTLGFSTEAEVRDIRVHQGRIWAATNYGLASAPVNSPNLSGPSAWTRYYVAEGLPSPVCTKLTVMRDTLIVLTTFGSSYYNGLNFTYIQPSTGVHNIDAAVAGDSLYLFTLEPMSFKVNILTSPAGSLIRSQEFIQANTTSFFIPPSASAMYAGTATNGVYDFGGAQLVSHVPNSPVTGFFTNLAVDQNGRVWAATGLSAGTGFSRFNPTLPDSLRWKHFNVEKYPVLGSNNYFRMSVTSDGRVWAGNWGSGVAEIVEDTIRRVLDTRSTPPLSRTVDRNENPLFTIVSNVANDPEGKIWIANFNCVNGKHLVRLTSDTTAEYLSNDYNGEGWFMSMTIDQNGTKWFGNSEVGQIYPLGGLYYYNEQAVVSGSSPYNGWGKLTSADVLPSNVVFCLTTDLDGNVVAGTDQGMVIITDTRFPRSRNYKPFSLRGRSIQAVAVDALNNKWVGTREGVFVLSSDGTQLLDVFTTSSTGNKLLSDNIRSIAIDQRRGIVYIGTEIGLSSLAIAAVQTERSATELTVGPNPFILPDHQRVEIRNLVAGSTLKILSASGTVIKEFAAQGGGRGFWDGTASDGTKVSSGIYFVVAYAENGEQISTAKIAVIRK